MLTKYVQDEADEAVVGGERKQDSVDEDNVFEVVEDAFAVQEVHGDSQEVPVQGFCEP